MSAQQHPETHRGDVVDDLHGHRIADPYRWLEDPESAETKDWVRRQNEHTEAHLAAMPERAWFHETMARVIARPRHGALVHEAGWWFVARNDGTQAQNVLYVAPSLDELTEGGRVLLDPNGWSAEGTTSLNTWSVSPDGTYVAYAVSEGGSDWVRLRVKEIATGDDVDDVEVVTKFSYPEWLPDSRSFLYHRYADTGRAEGTDTKALTPSDLMAHRIGRPLADDVVVVERTEDPMVFTHGQVMADGTRLVVSLGWGTERKARLWVAPLETSDGETTIGAFTKVVDELVDDWEAVRIDGDDLIALTDHDAPLGRVVRLPIVAGATPGADVVAEGEWAIGSVRAAGDGLVVETLEDVTPVVTRWSLAGEDLGRIDVQAGVVAISAHAGVDEVCVFAQTVTSPCRQYVASFATGEVRAVDLVLGDDSFEAPAITVERRRATSADGTEVPYFLIIPEGHDLAAPAPTLVYGYGGFSIPVYADYRPGWAGWLAAGGVLVIANLRGGSEYGKAWYDGGRGPTKQNVFDDVNAVGDHLVATGVARPDQLTIHGRSNGGLLAGAALTQRPDLWAVALPVVGVLDLLRFHKFTGGLAWASDYGNPDVAEDFEVALAYSPLHRVEEETRYPATLIATGDHDDRVVPLHSHKFAAALQHAQAGDAPILTRIEVATGHGMGKPAGMLAAEWADLLAFAAHHTGLSPQG